MKKRKRRAAPTITHAGIVIREVRPGYYLVDVQRNGQRQRKAFSDLQDAKTYCDILRRKIDNEGFSVLDLTPDQRSDAKKALAILASKTTLQTAAAFWMRHHGGEDGVTLRQLGDRWLIALRGQGCRETTMREREHKVTRLCSDLGGQTVASITRDELVQWMDAYRLSGATRDGYRRCYRAMFEYAVTERMIEVNPASGIRRIRMDERLPTPFTVDAVEKVLRAAQRYAPNMLPHLVVQFFAGLRPGEALGLDWSAIDWREKIIRVTPETSKVRRSRIVDMNPTLLAWLAPYRQDTGPISVTTRNQWDYYATRKDCDGASGILGAAGVDWIQDGPRKTFASAHYATHSDAAKLAAILGHTGGHDVLFRHYRGLMTKREARRFWKLSPEAKGAKVISMRAATA